MTGFHPICIISCLTLIPALEKWGTQVITAFQLPKPRAGPLAMVLAPSCLMLRNGCSFSLSLSLRLIQVLLLQSINLHQCISCLWGWSVIPYRDLPIRALKIMWEFFSSHSMKNPSVFNTILNRLDSISVSSMLRWFSLNGYCSFSKSYRGF